jgi:UDP-N-acetylenolpyruvoylglucosamine reductase
VKIDPKKCVACGNCTYVCPVGAIYIDPATRRVADPLLSCTVTYLAEGDQHGWHFDGNDFVVSLLLQAPESGGRNQREERLETRRPRRREQEVEGAVRAVSGLTGNGRGPTSINKGDAIHRVPDGSSNVVWITEVRSGLTGLEFGLAIPGTVGGAVWANAGAHDGDVAGILESADVLLADGSEARLTVDELAFRYRDSRLKRRPEEVVLAATFRLEPADPAAIAARLDDIKRWRREHQPLGIPSAGSTFRNPPDDSAGRLIDALGWKGRTRGGATVSEKHANFIVNDRKGTAADVRGLIDEVAAAVEHETGIRLEEEVVFLGDWGDRP